MAIISKVVVTRFSLLILLLGLLSSQVLAETHRYDFDIKEASCTRLCQTKKILTVNGKFTGPTINARKGDKVIVRVSNKANENVTLHWNGVKQPRNPWSTQNLIKPGANFTYTILLAKEEGTLWWRVQSDWSRAIVDGAIIVHSKIGTSFSFPTPYKEIPLILGEWWNSDVGEIFDDVLRTRANPILSKVFTINGQPGDLYPCSKQDTFKVKVVYGKTYLLKIINTALTNDLFFAIAGHRMTVIGTNGSYVKPYTVNYITVTPGQTMDVLLEAKPTVRNPSVTRFYMAVRSYNSTTTVKFDNTTTTTAVVEYLSNSSPLLPDLPANNDTNAATNFTKGLQSPNPVDVPKTVDERIVITIAVNEILCPNRTCQGINGTRFGASLNNIRFVSPSIDILQAYYRNIEGVFGTDFPTRPPVEFNFTGNNIPQGFLFPMMGTEVKVLEYGKNVELVFQGTNLIQGENHPMHLHGFTFYVVGRGYGNFDEKKDPLSYNLRDPPRENTIGVNKNGWAAVRFRATNPGVWFMHCHLERHSTWGMDTVFIVKNGANPTEKMLPPPKNMPPC